MRTGKTNTQAKKFKSLARAVECDENEKAFEDKLRRISRRTEKSPQKKPAVKRAKT